MMVKEEAISRCTITVHLNFFLSSDFAFLRVEKYTFDVCECQVLLVQYNKRYVCASSELSLCQKQIFTYTLEGEWNS